MTCAATERRHCTGDLRCARLGSQKMKRRIVCKWVYPVNDAVGCVQLEISRNLSMYFHFSCLIYLATFAFTTFHILLQGISCLGLFRVCLVQRCLCEFVPSPVAKWLLVLSGADVCISFYISLLLSPSSLQFALSVLSFICTLMRNSQLVLGNLLASLGRSDNLHQDEYLRVGLFEWKRFQFVSLFTLPCVSLSLSLCFSAP